jgi:hypothetical protein
MARRNNAPDLRDAVPWWTDDDGVVHICESAVPVGSELVIRTLCDREVEPGATFIPSKDDEVTCSKCAAADAMLKRRALGTRDETALA